MSVGESRRDENENKNTNIQCMNFIDSRHSEPATNYIACTGGVPIFPTPNTHIYGPTTHSRNFVGQQRKFVFLCADRRRRAPRGTCTYKSHVFVISHRFRPSPPGTPGLVTKLPQHRFRHNGASFNRINESYHRRTNE